MTQLAHLWLFFLLVLGIVVLPGMDMAYVLASSLVGGRRAGLVAVAGIVAGGACHVATAAFGIALLFRLVPWLVDAMLLAGAAYIAWIALAVLRSASALGALPALRSPTLATTFRRALLTCLLNPKAYLFMLAVFPQFLRPQDGPAGIQALALGLIIAATQTGVYGSVALLAGRSRDWLATRPAIALGVGRTVGSLLLVGAVVTAVEGLRRW